MADSAAFERYRVLLGPAPIRLMLLAGGLAYVGIEAEPLAMLLLARDATGGYATGALVVGAYGLTSALLAPLRGRSVYRRAAGAVGGLLVDRLAASGAFLVAGLAVAAAAPLALAARGRF